MTIPIQSIEENLSIAYACAVIAKAGKTIDIPSKDFGVDLAVRQVTSFQGERVDMGVVFDCQLKASINWTLESGHVVYDFEAKAYNKLVRRLQGSTIPCLLIFMALPRDYNQWLTLDEDQLLLRKCCYWDYITGPLTDNTDSIRIRIPRTQMFTPDCVKDLVDKVLQGKAIK